MLRSGSELDVLMEIKQRIDACDWPSIETDLDAYGVGRLGTLLTPEECTSLVETYDAEDAFRSRVIMSRHGFGQGEYKYFRYPLPDLVADIRTHLYPHAARTANRWAGMLGTQDHQFPNTHQAMLQRCHRAGQTRPTPLLLRYEAGDFNCLHQDLYGEHVFPLQAVILLSDSVDFEGGEFVLTEQRPRMQSRAEVVTLGQGEVALFAVNERPRQGTRGYHRVRMRHGVSRLRSGQRLTAGVIFHDAN